MPHTPVRTHSTAATSIAIVGLGPRGTSLIERLGAHLDAAAARGDARADAPLDLHLIDDAQAGAGRIWRTDQTRELCMNTLADAVTLFTEPGSTVTGPIRQGPTLYEWALLVRDGASAAVPAAHAAAFSAHPTRQGLAADYRAELAELRPESHPSRALYGEYLVWCFDRAIAALPASVRVVHHRARAERIARVDGRERLTLDTGATVAADAAILATGWLPRTSTPAERAIEAKLADHPGLTWVRQGSPVDQDLSGVPAGEPVIVRGLGMGFFDTMALLTIGRGGVFTPDPAAPGGLRYAPSGHEPIIHVTSHRGVPFRAKSLYRSLPPRAAQTLLREVEWDSIPRPINFDQLLWPRIVGDGFIAHATALREIRPEALGTDAARADAALGAIADAVRTAIAPILAGAASAAPTATVDAVAAAVAPHIPSPADRFDLAGELTPVDVAFSGPAAFDAWVAERVAADLRAAEQGRANALKAGLWSISSARAVSSRIGTLGGFDAESRRGGYALLLAVGGMVGSGPPAFRSSQLLALASAGIVHFIGPEAALTVDDRGFVASSPLVAGSEVVAPALIDAWMHFHRLAETADPLSHSLVEAGRARPFTVAARASGPAAGTRLTTGGIDIDGPTGRLRGADGTVDAAVHASGIPVDETLHDTVISPMPGTDPFMLRETDRVALSTLEAALAATAAPTLTSTGATHD
ncbi:FAD/NAD(P)-binding protein [Leucobacter luti]|uniref:FAD-NAD(P)-binding protein n=1 Tax=Leucobacter luti TaxID=340320 RepID=A0A4Q7U1J4_9MICO|nr:FAD/NAD(P)-binding protein [Leucobacter luti]MBL3699107.1 hypothetical protein [Leucobacter luti]RZT66610.1 FAD-NAD(P)-binding protein [Leucobacter luti]